MKNHVNMLINNRYTLSQVISLRHIFLEPSHSLNLYIHNGGVACCYNDCNDRRTRHGAGGCSLTLFDYFKDLTISPIRANTSQFSGGQQVTFRNAGGIIRANDDSPPTEMLRVSP